MLFFPRLLKRNAPQHSTRWPPGRRPAGRFRPGVEVLEARAVPAVLNVTTPLDEVDPNDGLLSLREAVLQANAGNSANTIALPAATYYLTLGDLQITGRLTITGAGADSTVIDGHGLTGVFLGGVFDILHDAKQVTISGVTIQGGVANEGGGIYAEAGVDLTIDHCTLSANRAVVFSGAVSADGCTITDSTISGNQAGSGGGGISAVTLTMDHCIVSDNLVSDGPFGGGISARNATITNSKISGNQLAHGLGAGIDAEALTMDHCTVSDNRVFDGFGGGIYVTSGTIEDSTVRDNTASAGGGVYSDGSLTVSQSTIRGNTASDAGGGIYFHIGGTLTVDQSTISCNTASHQGGGVYADNSIVSVNQSTISDNTASQGGGLYVYSCVAEINQSTLNDAGGGIWKDSSSSIHLQQTWVDGVLYQNQDYP
jgi:parallel beta-helix repeat protein